MSLNWNTIKNMFLINDRNEYDEEEFEDNLGPDYDEPVQHTPQTNSTSSAFRPAKTGGYNTVAQRPNAMKVVIVEPTVFEDSEKLLTNFVICVPWLLILKKQTLMKQLVLSILLAVQPLR